MDQWDLDIISDKGDESVGQIGLLVNQDYI